MSHTLTEILTQPLAWQSALRQAERILPDWRSILQDESTPLVFTGCGSTWYLAEIAAALFRRLTGRLTFAVPGGELLLYPQDWLGERSAFPSKPALIAVSRSGATTETLRAVEAWRAEGGRVLAVTNYPDSPLPALADAALVIPEGREESVAQTRSFASMLVGLNALAVLLGEKNDLWNAMPRLPQAGERLIQHYQPLAQSLGEDLSLERFYFLGSG
ncbi:MAG: SIS domain-containing protein, partial [Anaerolineales bacterium]